MSQTVFYSGDYSPWFSIIIIIITIVIITIIIIIIIIIYLFIYFLSNNSTRTGMLPMQ